MAVIKNTSVLFSNVSKIDDFSQKYQVVVQLTEDQSADAEAAGLKVKTKEHEGKTQFQVTFKTKFGPRIVGADGKTDMDLKGAELGRGSKVNVQYKERAWTAPGGKQGISHDLVAVQVLEIEAPNASEFEDESEFGNEDTSSY